MTVEQIIIKVGRDARTGKFIPVKKAKQRPSTTVVETIKRPRIRRLIRKRPK